MKMKKQAKHLQDFKHPLNSRRDFLAHGVLAFSGFAMMPSLAGASQYFRRLSCSDTVSGMIPFMVFDAAGGASMPGNFLAGKAGGPEDLLASYSRLGWDPRESGSLNTEFGLPMSAKKSKILEGILANTSPEARKNFKMGSLCHFAQDDSNGNRLNSATLVLKAGNRGSYITNGMGIVSSVSGGNSAAVQEAAALKPTFVKSVNDVLGATSFGGPSFAGIGVSNLRALGQGGVELSQVQLKDYQGLQGDAALNELSKCAYGKSLSFVEGVQGLDPRQDALAQAVYQINANSDANSSNAVAAALAMNAVKGFSGPSVWTLGGCDYHDGSQSTGDQKDLELGTQIGRAVELAHRNKKPFFFQLITDGGVAATENTRIWSADSGDKCMTVIGYYSPEASPKMIRKQVGYYTDGQGAEQKTLIGAEPQLVAYAVLANYLNVSGKLGEFQSYAPGVFTGSGQLESVLLFEGKATS